MAEEEVQPLEEEEPALEAQDDANRAVASSMVASWGYDRADEQIEVFFNNGHFDTYACSPEQWEEAKVTSSPGRFMHDNFL